VRAKAGLAAAGRALRSGAGRTATRGGCAVIELEYGSTVYPAREEKLAARLGNAVGQCSQVIFQP